MEILFITKNTKPTAGIGRYSKEIINHVQKLGVDIRIFSEETGVYEKKSLYNFLRNCIHARLVARKVDVVHALDAWPFGMFALFAVWGTKKQLFLSGVGTYSVPPKRISFKRFLFLLLYKRASGVFCISAYTVLRIQERLPFKVFAPVIHLATSPLALPSVDIRTKFNISKNAWPIFITVGEVKERKGQKDTLLGLEKLKEKYPNFLYLIVGGQSDSVYVSSIFSIAKELNIEKNVQGITEAHTDADLAGLYNVSDIHFLNSNNDQDHFEGFGLVFLEANQFGVPSVGSRDCGIEDAINNGVSGLLVKQKDHEGIKDAAFTILQNHKVFSQGAKNWYSNFSWRKTAEGYYLHYKA